MAKKKKVEVMVEDEVIVVKCEFHAPLSEILYQAAKQVYKGKQ